MPIGLLDLSIVTDRLIGKLTSRTQGQPFDINVTGLPPDEIRNLPEACYLSLYLFHISQDSFQRNSPVTGPWTPPPSAYPTKTSTRVPPTPFQPLSLDLHYVLTAYAKGSYIKEQQAMSIALKCFHENPIIRATVPIDGRIEEFCLTMETESADEVGRLWQALSTSLRLAVIYKVSVIFIEPPAPPSLALPVQTIDLAVGSTSLPFADQGQVIGTYIKVNYIAPTGTGRNFELRPAVAAPGQEFLLYGAGLNKPSSNRLYLLLPDGTEQDVTAIWATSAALQTESRFTLNLPTTGIPIAGVYQLRVGNNITLGTSGAIRSNATPFSIAAWIDPTGGAILIPIGTTYTLNGLGFSSATLEVLLETVALVSNPAVGAGQFAVNGAGTAISFQLPVDIPNGLYAVRVRVNQVESHPTKWVVKGP